MVSRWECADCGKKFASKNKLRKHQRKQNPRHTGMIEVKSANTPTTRNKPKTTPKKTPKAGNRAKGTYKPPAMKKDGPIEPEYESGVIRISEEAWNQIKDLLTENMVHKKVDSTGHHLIFFNGEGYSELDFMMYEFNFCEQEMFYEDLSMALLDYANDEKITIQDMCELGISIVEGVDGQIINSTPLSEADVETLTVQELAGLIAPLSGLAIAYGRFKPKPKVSTYSYGKGRTTTTTKFNKTRKPITTTKPKPVSKPVSKSQTQITDFMDEKWKMNNVEADDEEDDFGIQDDFVWDQVRDDWDYIYSSEEDFSRGYSGGWGSSSYSTAARTAVPLEPKYHPIYGIRGMKIQVDRYVDLTPMIEADEAEAKEAEGGGSLTRQGYPVWSVEYEWETVPNPHPHEDKINEDEISEKVHERIQEEVDRGGKFGFDNFHEIVDVINEDGEKDQEYIDISVEYRNDFGAENFEASEGGFKLNVATLPVDEAYDWSLKQFEDAGLKMEEYIPHFKENYASLQEECQGALDVPRIEMPVIDPEQLEKFATSLMAGQLDVFEPFAEGRKEVYSPKDLFGDTNRAWKFLFLGLQDGRIDDDVVTARIQRTVVGLMRPTQSQIWLEKLIGNIIQFGQPQADGSGAYNNDSIILQKTIAISQEGFILDGHHRYAQIALVNPALRMRTLYIAMPMRRLLDISRPYGNAIGNEQRG